MKCPKCGEDTLKEVPTMGSNVLGKSYKCSNPKCGYSQIPSNEGKTLSELMNKKKSKNEEE